MILLNLTLLLCEQTIITIIKFYPTRHGPRDCYVNLNHFCINKIVGLTQSCKHGFSWFACAYVISYFDCSLYVVLHGANIPV